MSSQRCCQRECSRHNPRPTMGAKPKLCPVLARRPGMPRWLSCFCCYFHFRRRHVVGILGDNRRQGSRPILRMDEAGLVRHNGRPVFASWGHLFKLISHIIMIGVEWEHKSKRVKESRGLGRMKFARAIAKMSGSVRRQAESVDAIFGCQPDLCARHYSLRHHQEVNQNHPAHNRQTSSQI